MRNLANISRSFDNHNTRETSDKMDDIAEGSTLMDRYLILKKLGKGGFGKVYKAVDLLDKSEVAVKVSYGGGSVKEWNVLEAQILKAIQSVDSPSRNLVVSMKDSYEFDDCVILVLELMSHDFLKSIEHDKALDSLETVSKYGKQMLEFLCFMSQVDVIHGDIKPENILMDEETKEIKFADFGMAHCPWSPFKKRSIQTLFYKAPEVLLGHDYDSSVDTWSVGCVLVECLTTIPLFCVKDKLELMRNIARIIGTPSQKVISESPRRDKYFWFDDCSRQWVVKGFESPIVPMGLRKYFETNHSIDTTRTFNKLDFLMFVDLVESMVRLDPRTRFSPEECLNHPFITRRLPCYVHEKSVEDKCPGNSARAELSRFSKRLNIGTSITLAAMRTFNNVRNMKAIRRQDTHIVMLCCLYAECHRRRVPKTFGQFADASGIHEAAIRRVWRLVKEAADDRKNNLYKINRPKKSQ